MENLNAEAVKKALECCSADTADCHSCPYSEFSEFNCFDNAKKDALALINSQEQRLKELTEENERLREIISSVARFDTSLLCAWCREEQTKKIAKEMLEGEE
jgi:hypothetical protein